jgi:S-adenosylmethionine:tRNA ribosyltransferase-isomerase
MLNPLKTSSYDYTLPKNLIASYPVTPADEAKLLVYNRSANKITHTIFKHILDFLPKDIDICFNDTKVIKARLYGKKDTGGKIEILFNKPLSNDQYLIYIKGKVKQNTKLIFQDNLIANVILLNQDGTRVVEFYKNNQKLSFEQLIKIFDKIGHIPLPPYLNREDQEEDNTTYQTLFAKNYGAVAAPTASLHFTPELLEKLKQNFKTHYLTLHVGAGTFKPVDCNDILQHPMHSEFYNIPNDTKQLLDSNKKILAIGTTVTRTIEYYHQTKLQSSYADIFLHPCNKPKRVNYLLTNFHLPKSTLIMLVASFIGLKQTLKIYQEAIKHQYRFFSYGDTMLIL